MLVSIIIPTLDEQASIGATARALNQLAGEKEILVVDGGSADQTVWLAQETGATVLTAPRGRGSQLRAGAEQARGDVLWFVHADTTPPQNAIDAMADALSRPDVVGGNFALRFDGSSRSARWMTRIYPVLRRLRLCYGDSGIFVRRHIYLEIGGIRPVALFEDLDLLGRMRRAGRFVHLAPCLTTSSRRFEERNFAGMWAQWTALQILYWCGVPPDRLARLYHHVR